MSYVVDRATAVRDVDIVGVFSVRRRGARSRVLLSDGSLLQTLTRPHAFRQKSAQPRKQLKGIVWASA